LLVGPPAAICWHWRHQHWRTATGSGAEIVAVTAPQAQRPVKAMAILHSGIVRVANNV
jgi:hypothetical protein